MCGLGAATRSRSLRIPQGGRESASGSLAVATVLLLILLHHIVNDGIHLLFGFLRELMEPLGRWSYRLREIWFTWLSWFIEISGSSKELLNCNPCIARKQASVLHRRSEVDRATGAATERCNLHLPRSAAHIALLTGSLLPSPRVPQSALSNTMTDLLPSV